MTNPAPAKDDNPANPQPAAMQRLVQRLSRLPGIGTRSAQRIAFHLLKADPKESIELARALSDFKSNLTICGVCHNVAERDPCAICGDDRRDRSTVLVVEQPADVASLEATGMYRGVYHVLMGRLAPLEGVGVGELNIRSLLDRVRVSREKSSDQATGQTAVGPVQEVIIGTNPTLDGDGTALYLAQELTKLGVRVSRLARGLPTGANLETVSKAVLAEAIQGRRGVD